MRTLLLAAAVCAALGCAKKEEGPEAELPAPEPITTSEADLGRKACAAYVTQVCACAEKKAELASECEMARARPQAFEMNARAAMAEGDATSKDRRILIANSRKIMRACIEDSAELVKQGCAAAAPPAPAPAE